VCVDCLALVRRLQIIELRTEETKFRRLLELLGQWFTKGLILIFVDKQARTHMLSH
jgi:ATP-dependent RNA helicase DDX46/PRP5